MNILNNTGERMLPCLVPRVTRKYALIPPSLLTVA